MAELKCLDPDGKAVSSRDRVRILREWPRPLNYVARVDLSRASVTTEYVGFGGTVWETRLTEVIINGAGERVGLGLQVTVAQWSKEYEAVRGHGYWKGRVVLEGVRW